MAVVARKRKRGTVYYVVNEWQGKQAWEKVGPQKRDAEQRDRAMKREIDANTYQPPTESRALTVRQYAATWGANRTNASAEDERRNLRLYVLSRPWLADKRLDEVVPVDMDKLVDELRVEKKKDKQGAVLAERRLSDKTIANALGTLHQMYASAVRAGHCARQPVLLERGSLQRQPPTEKETYTAAEVVILTHHHKISWPIRVLNGFVLLAGMREGEACGRRWRDLGDATPLPGLFVRDQYNGKPLKTRRPRWVPVHLELGKILDEWAREGFELYTGRKPTPDDFIVPSVSARAKSPCHTRSSYYKAFTRYAEAAGVRPRSLHATRHTFVTLCRRGGARKDTLEKVTHNAKGDIVDRYTHFDWAPLCEAVSCLKLDAHQELHPGGGNGGESRTALAPTYAAIPNNSAPMPLVLSGSIPGAST